MSERFSENKNRFGTFEPAAVETAKDALRANNRLLVQAGLSHLPPETLDQARGGGLEDNSQQFAALEAIVRITNRPPLAVRGGVVDLTDLPDGIFDPKIGSWIKAIEPMLGSIGRIEFTNHDMDWGGTGWVIDEKGADLLVATNRHVAAIVARRTSRGGGVFMFAPGGAGRYGAAIDFNDTIDAASDKARRFAIVGFDYIADDAAADVAIARIRSVPKDLNIGMLPLAKEDGDEKELIAVVGYPARDSRNDATHMERYFKGLYDVKRLSPGFLHNRGGGARLIHDATTLGGSSGSPILSLKRKVVVGLHFSGRYGVGNSAVRAATLMGILDGTVTSVPGVALGTGGEERRDGEHHGPDMANRDGYDPGFLGEFHVPMPNVEGVAGVELATPDDATAGRPHELRYTHFGVLYCRRYRSPVVAAVNIDGQRSVPIKRGPDQWFYDLRIPKSIQVGSEAYSDAGVDRGHMVKREDPNWGTDDAALAANFDTFHLPNCSPQHAGFNRNLQTWRGLEDYILGNARTHGFKACVFTGPILGEDMETLDTGLSLPAEYWKLVVMPTMIEGEIRPHVTAYVLSQGVLIQKLLQDREDNEAVEGFAFGEYRTFQISVAALEEVTGLDFGGLNKFDALGREGEQESSFVFKALSGLEDAIL